MNREIYDAALALIDILVQENDALRALDLRQAAALAERKNRTIETFLLAESKLGDARPSHPLERAALGEMTTCLRELIAENRRLLEHAITVQQRVIGVVARAVPKAARVKTPYRADGTAARSKAVPAYALSARA
jgi:hypothetical protein